jgi:hypothetical protein
MHCVWARNQSINRSKGRIRGWRNKVLRPRGGGGDIVVVRGWLLWHRGCGSTWVRLGAASWARRASSRISQHALASVLSDSCLHTVRTLSCMRHRWVCTLRFHREGGPVLRTRFSDAAVAHDTYYFKCLLSLLPIRCWWLRALIVCSFR